MKVFYTGGKVSLSQLLHQPHDRQHHLLKMLAVLLCRPVLLHPHLLLVPSSDPSKIRRGHVTCGIWVETATTPKLELLIGDLPEHNIVNPEGVL